MHRRTKDQRYDRQIRLWGDHGQVSIEEAKLCLINCGSTGAEILKNLVLPGVGSFTIVDDSRVREEDVGCNFFLNAEDVGRPRAQAVTEKLLELNECVSGSYITENVADLMDNEPNFFLGFTVVVMTDARESLWLRLSRLLREANIPLVICITVGVIGYLRVSTAEHVIVESHPDSTRPDLRLDRPLAGLIEMCSETDLETMSSKHLSQTPWLLIVHIFVQRFIQQHGNFPQNHKEKLELREMILKASVELASMAKQREPSSECLPLDNFQEAARAVNTAVCLTEIPPEIKELLDDNRCNDSTILSPSFDGSTNLLYKPHLNPPLAQSSQTSQTRSSSSTVSTPSSSSFWRLVSALRDFVNNEGDGQLPVRGSLPDMMSDSKRYLRLLSIYQDRCEWAVQRLASRLTQFPEITIQDIRLFVKNAAFLRVVRCRSLEEEMKLSPARSDDLGLIPTHEDNDALLWYLVLRGAFSFLSETGRWPGSSSPYLNPISHTGLCSASAHKGDCHTTEHIQPANSSPSEAYCVEADLPSFLTHLTRVLRAFGIAPNRVSLDYVNELCRFGGSELHSVAAFMGGVVAQEVIKLITHQFVPITEPLIYNAITQRTELVTF